MEKMALYPTRLRSAVFLMLTCTLFCHCVTAQGTPADSPPLESDQSATSSDRPLPDIAALMRDVEANQRRSEAIEKDYIYHSVETEQEVDGHGQIKKTTVDEYDNFWVNGVPVRRMVKKDGKPLSADEIAKEDERIDNLAAKANERREKADAQGKETDPRGNEEITVSRLLELGAFTSPRRVQLNGRDTIAADFTGDPKAKTRNRAEEVLRDLSGTAWIDERDHVLARVEGHFVKSFKIAGGLVANVQQDTHFSMEQIKVNDEVWLPSRFEGQGSFHVLLFFGFDGSAQIVNSDYRKFRATSRILPGATPAGSPEPQSDSAQP
jgi:hypothetical protein